MQQQENYEEEHVKYQKWRFPWRIFWLCILIIVAILLFLHIRKKIKANANAVAGQPIAGNSGKTIGAVATPVAKPVQGVASPVMHGGRRSCRK